MSLKIWCISAGETSTIDGTATRLLRHGILARELRKRGHDVTWFNQSIEHLSKKQRVEKTTIVDGQDGLKLVFLYGKLYKRNISIDRIISHRQQAAALKNIATQLPKPDIVVCSYPPIEVAEAAVDFCTTANIPIIIDLRDMWPDIIANVAPPPLRWLSKALIRTWFKSSRKIAVSASGLVGISQPFLDWGLANAGREQRDSDRVLHLANDPIINAITMNEVDRGFLIENGIQDSQKLIAFAGTLSRRLDLATIVEGMHIINQTHGDNIILAICGTGELEKKLHVLAGDCPNIRFLGWCDQRELNVIFSQAIAGVLPYPSLEDFQISFPNKVGEYLSHNLPVLTCLKGEVKSLIESEECGLMYAEGNAQSFANAVIQIASDEEFRKKCTANANRIYNQKFNAAKIYEQYSDYIEQMARK